MKRIAFLKLGMTLVASEIGLSGCASDDDDDDDDAGNGAGATGGAASGAGSASGGAGSAAIGGQGATAMLCSTDANVLQTSMESHDHLPLTSPITAAHLNAGSPTEFATASEQNHIHTLTFSEPDFVALRAGMVVVKRSSSMMGHTHTYTIKCV